MSREFQCRWTQIIHDASIQVKALYDDIPNKAAQAGAGKVAQLSGAQENDVRTEVEKARKAGKDFVQAAEAGAKKLPSGKGPVARLALTALVGKEHDVPVERENALRDVNSESKPALPKATAFAIGAGIGVVAAKAGLAGFGNTLSKPVIESLLVDHKFDIDGVRNSIDGRIDVLEHVLRQINYRAGLVTGGIVAANNPEDLKRDIHKRLINHYLKQGRIDNISALKILNEAISDHNKAHNENIAPLPAANRGFDRFNKPLEEIDADQGTDLPAPFFNAQVVKDSLVHEAQKAYIMTAGIQAIQNVETSHPQADQDSKTQNFREVAAVVVPVAMDNGCTQEEAIKLAERFTKFYVEKEGKLDGLKLDEVKNYIEQAKPGTVDPALTKTAKMLLRAVHSAAKLLPKDQGMGGVAAGTTVASDIFPTLKKSPAAGATAALIEQVRGSEGVNISRSTAYVEGLTHITPSMTPFSVIAASGIAARRGVKAGNNTNNVALSARTAYVNVEAPGVNFEDLPNPGHIWTIASESFQTVHRVLTYLLPIPPATATTSELRQRAAIMGAYIGATGARLGLDENGVTRTVALALTSPNVMRKGSVAYMPTVQAALALERAKGCLAVVDALNTAVPNEIKIPAGGMYADSKARLEDAINNRTLPNGAAARNADEAYLAAKNHFLNGVAAYQLPHNLDTKPVARKQYFEKVAEVVGNKAAADFSMEKLKTGNLADEAEFNQTAKQAQLYAKRVVEGTASLKAQVKKLTGDNLVGDAYKIPAEVDQLTAAQLTDSGWMAELVHTGLRAGEEAKVEARVGRDPEEQARITLEENAERAAAAAEAIARKSGVTDPEKLKEIREIAKKAVQDGETPAVIGALIAARIPGSPPEVAHAYAVTVTELTLDPHAPEQEKSLALAEAASSAAIGEDRALPTAPDKEVELREVANDERVRREKAAKAANDDRLRGELRKLPEDETGVTTATKTLETMVIDVHGIELTLPTYGTDHHGPQLLSEVPGCEQIFEDLKSCGKFVDSETLEQAIAAINARYGLQLKVTGHGTGTVRADLTGMSPGRIGELMQEWVKTSKAKQAKAVVAKNDQAVKQQIAQTNSMRVGPGG